MMIASGAIASRLRAVSISVSPLVTDEVEAEMLMESADRRLAAISKLVRVRVDDSKKKLMIVLPRRVGTFLIARLETSLNDVAVSRIVVISSTDKSLMPNKSFRLNANLNRVGLLPEREVSRFQRFRLVLIMPAFSLVTDL